MNLYKYTGKDKNGELLSGEIEAENEMAAARLLSSRDIVAISVSTGSETGLAILERLPLKEKVVIIRQLATMINAGLPISQSLKTLEGQATRRVTKKILTSAVSDIEGGSPLSIALSKFPEVFTPLDITLIASGETSGSLDKSLLSMASQLEKEQSLVRKVRGAMVYPLFIIFVVILVMIGMIVFVMPQMAELYKSFGAKLPLMTRIFIGLSEVLVKAGPLIILILAALGFYIRAALKRPLGRRVWDEIKIKTPPLNSLLLKMYMARFSRTLSGLVASGVPLLDSLDIVSRSVGNVVYEDIVNQAAKKVKAGVALSSAIRPHPEFSPVVAEMITVGEKTGELDKMLSNLADYFEAEVDEAVKSISNLIEPIVIVFLGGMIAMILIAIMLPIYQIGSIV